MQPQTQYVNLQPNQPVKKNVLPKVLLACGGLLAVCLVFTLCGGGALGGYILYDNANAAKTSTVVAQEQILLYTQIAWSAQQTYEARPTPTPYSTPTPFIQFYPDQVSAVDAMVMVFVPAGEFIMGSDDFGALDSESPQHTVYLDAFWVDRTEVTNAMYALCVQDGVCDPPNSFGSDTRTSYYDNNSYADFPVVNVEWENAVAYCSWAGRQLPTEAQWEKAARGTDGRIFPWGDGDADCTLANYEGCGSDTVQVGSYPDGASPYGALDMAGNVWEWVWDWFVSDYYSYQDYMNPTGPASGEYRLMRGGAFMEGFAYIRTSNRPAGNYGGVSAYTGFRCVAPADVAP